MYSIALHNTETHSLTLARDRLGEKPLYYGVIDGRVFFASELKAFRGWSDFTGKIDKLAISQYLYYGFVPAPESIFLDAKKLKPGHFITFSFKCTSEQTCFWDISKIPEIYGVNKLSRPQALSGLKSLLYDSVKLRMKSDVRTGTFLSGGIDSSLITAMIQAESDVQFDSYTIGFGEKDFDESPAAKRIAKYIGTNHHEFHVSETELLDLVPKMAGIYCEPFADESQIPTVLVSEIAAKEVKVILSGDGGDELFGGYNRHIASHSMGKVRRVISASMIGKISPMLTERTRPMLQALLSKFGRNVNINQLHKLVDAFGEKTPVQVYQQLLRHSGPYSSGKTSNDAPAVDVFGRSLKLDSLTLSESVMAYDQMFYLPDNILAKVDRASMSASLETRVPFLDHRLVEFSWRISIEDKIKAGVGKTLLREMLYEYVPKKLFSDMKSGFDVPISSWLNGPLKDWSYSLIYDELENEYVDLKYIKRLWVEHTEKGIDHGKELWKILTLLSWIRNWSNGITDFDNSRINF
jgi:asparagine synthase (glutamine-hydrolysing)